MSKEKSLTRRDFLKFGSLSALSLPLINVINRIGTDEIISSEEIFGGFLVRRLSKGEPPYDVDNSIYERMDARNNGFSRMLWDGEFVNNIFEGLGPPPRGETGFKREDEALSNAGWTAALWLDPTATEREELVTTIGGGPPRGILSHKPLAASSKHLRETPWDNDYSDQKKTEIVKKAAHFFGASLVGITELDERWVYSNNFDEELGPDNGGEGKVIFSEDYAEPEILEDGTIIIPKSMQTVIVLGFEMDYDGNTTAPALPAEAATTNGYSRMAFTAGTVAEFIRNLGYKALPAGNNLGLSIPFAIDAGFGELGRNGLLITPKYGPRVRIAKVFTDLPLNPDSPIRFGVTEFCEVCGKCAKDCPGNAISSGERTREPVNISTNPGVLKWPIDAEKCLRGWMTFGSGCASCIRSCPFNKPDSWLHDATRILIGVESGAIDSLLLNLDDASGYGQATSAEDAFWQKDNYIHIK